MSSIKSGLLCLIVNFCLHMSLYASNSNFDSPIDSLVQDDSPKVVVVTNTHYIRHANKLLSEVQKQNLPVPKLVIVPSDSTICEERETLENYDLIVTLGRRGLKHAICYNGQIPIYSLLISKSHYRAVLRSNGIVPSANEEKDRTISAFYIEHPVTRHLLLIKSLEKFMDSPLRAGVILGENTVNSLDELREASEELGVDLDIMTVKEEESPADALKKLLEDHNLVLAIPDNGVFDRTNARGMLMLSLAKKVPVIGFTHATTDSGALAALYTPKYRQIKEASAVISNMLKNKSIILPKERHPEFYSISINFTVRKRLMPDLPSSDVLSKMLQNEMRKADEK